jgi:hypothetical protein
MLAMVLGGAGLSPLVAGAAQEGSANIPVEAVADYIHAVIEADRTIYTKHVVERMQQKGVVVASEDWEKKGTLPLPAQFLNDSNRLIARGDIGIRYRLISLWPIYERNAPATDLERKGLEAVTAKPGRPHTGFIESGGRKYFQAVYADFAVSQACIGCHNAHPKATKKDFKMGDVMGAVVVTVPLER